jgi:predicted GTPase
VKGRRVLVIEDGPTITHGGMPYGAGYLAAVEAGALVVDPRPWATGALYDVFATYPHIGSVLGRSTSVPAARGFRPSPLAGWSPATAVFMVRLLRQDD